MRLAQTHTRPPWPCPPRQRWSYQIRNAETLTRRETATLTILRSAVVRWRESRAARASQEQIESSPALEFVQISNNIQPMEQSGGIFGPLKKEVAPYSIGYNK